MNPTVGQISAIEERIAMSDQLERAASGRDAERQAAEGQGLRAAMRGEVPDGPYSSDSSLQSRFDLGLCDGRTILKVQAFEGHSRAGDLRHVA